MKNFITMDYLKASLPFGIIFLLGIGCSPKIVRYSGEKAFKCENGNPDYSNLDYWAGHPNKWDPSDTVPLLLKRDEREKVVDVFFLHPTTYTGAMIEGHTNAKLDDAVLNYKTDYSPLLYQASVFNERARVFAPRYRQAHIKMYSEQDSVKQYAAFNLAYNDIKEAFQYYLEHENKGRPIIIASHSQGTTHATRLVKEFFDGKPLMKQLVAAYLIGMRVNKDEYHFIQPCLDGEKTGCFISWRTFRKDYEGPWVSKLDSTIAVVNPISWKTDETMVDRSLHKGGVLYNLNKIYLHTQNAWIEGNALWITHPKFPGSFLYRNKNYHAGDINLFYVDIRENVSRRIDSYFQKYKENHGVF